MVNLKLLGVYYTFQKLLKYNLACPMARDIKPIIAMANGDFTILSKRVMPHLHDGVNIEKLNDAFLSLFSKIDSGAIKPERYLGYEFSADETIDQLEIHDSFMALYDDFFEHFKESKPTMLSIQEKTISDIKQLSIHKNEYWMFKEMLLKQEQRSPITLDIEELRDVVDIMYEAACKYHGPATTDALLSASVKTASARVPSFSAENFL